MASFTNCSFKTATVVLDGHEYNKCTFEKCKVVITRGNFSLRNSTFDGCSFEFGGEAANIKTLVMGLINEQKMGA